MKCPEKIKILHLIRSIGFGGAENQVLQILNGLNPELFSKYLVTFKHEELPNFPHLNNDIIYSVIPRKRWGHIPFIYQLSRFIKSHKIDIVQSHLFPSNLFAAVAGFIAGKTIVLTTEHGKNLWKNKVHHLIENRVISPLVQKRIAVSDDIRRIRIDTMDAPQEKMLVIHPCVEFPDVKTCFSIGPKTKIVSVGRLVTAKNYGILIEAINLLIKNGLNVELTIIGDGPERENIQNRINSLNLVREVKLVGFKTNIMSLLREYDIFALSSNKEGTPVAMLEAMSLGLPIVATEVGGIPDVLGNDRCGLLVPSNNPVDLSTAIKTLCLNPGLRRTLGEKARAHIKANYSQEAICRFYESVYLNLYTSAHGNRK